MKYFDQKNNIKFKLILILFKVNLVNLYQF